MLIDTQDYAPKLLKAICELGAAAPATLAGFQALDGTALVYSARALDAFGQQSG
jgi:hypothetical protein